MAASQFFSYDISSIYIITRTHADHQISKLSTSVVATACGAIQWQNQIDCRLVLGNLLHNRMRIYANDRILSKHTGIWRKKEWKFSIYSNLALKKSTFNSIDQFDIRRNVHTLIFFLPKVQKNQRISEFRLKIATREESLKIA